MIKPILRIVTKPVQPAGFGEKAEAPKTWGRRSAIPSCAAASAAFLAALFWLVSGLSAAPTATALNHQGDNEPSHAIDGNLTSEPVWKGLGAPNWLAIQLPEKEVIARIVIYPGNLKYASLPSTEASPAALSVQIKENGEWSDASEIVRVQRFGGQKDPDQHFIQIAFDAPLRTDHFRVYIHELQDKGLRVEGAILPENQRVVNIREVVWDSPEAIAEKLAAARGKQESARQQADQWRERFAQPGANPTILQALRSHYHDELEDVYESIAAGETAAWEGLRARLAPWEQVLAKNDSSDGAPEQTAPYTALHVQVDSGAGSRSFYPVSLELDFDLLEQFLGMTPDPQSIRVLPYDATEGITTSFLENAQGYVGVGEEPRYSPSRFDYETPARGRLTWSMRDAAQNEFLILFEDAAESETKTGSIGDGDHLYYAQKDAVNFPIQATSMAVVDWFGDGARHLLVGTQRRGVYLWRNHGEDGQMEFGPDYFEVLDSEGNRINAHPQRPDFGFSFLSPLDANKDGRLDFFLQSILNERPRILYFENLGPEKFPVMKPAQNPRGLARALTGFGDLNGDHTVDAVQAISDGETTWLEFRKGLPPGADGVPRFDGRGSRLVLGDEVFTAEIGKVHPTLADLNGDGLLDLSYFASNDGHVYISENVGTREQAEWATPYRLRQGGWEVRFRPYAGREAVNWGQITGNGLPEMLTSDGRIWQRTGRAGDPVRVGPRADPQITRQKVVSSFWGIGFDYADWTGNGSLDKIQPNMSVGPFHLLVRPFEDGYFQESLEIPVDARSNWYGCPDPEEYGILYPNLTLSDIDGDGDPDLFFATEHSWRFGYIHMYENMGDGTFGPEQKLRPGGTHDYVDYAAGVNGQGAHITDDTFLDFLSYPTRDNFDPAGGTLRFWFKPDWSSGNGASAYLFHTQPNPLESLNALELKRYYQKTHDDLRIEPGFALYKNEDDALCLRLWDRELSSQSELSWDSDQWYKIEVNWGLEGASIKVNDFEVLQDKTPVTPGEVGSRIYIGSQSVRFIQANREYSRRRAYHPAEWLAPANGVLDEFQILDTDGKALLDLSFDGHTDGKDGEDGSRLRVGYRSSPDFADLNGDGLKDMVVMVNDGVRNTVGQLYLFPNQGTPSQPDFGDPVPLKYTDGSPMRASARSHLSLVDWDGDGRTDIILANHGGEASPGNPTTGIQFFKNEGTDRNPSFAQREKFDRIHDSFHISHDPRAKAADFTGDGKLDMVVSSDPGIFFFTRSFLDEEPPQVSIKDRLTEVPMPKP